MTVSQPHLPSQRTPDGKVGEVPMSPTRSVPTGLQKSTETLNSITDAGSIGKNTCPVSHILVKLFMFTTMIESVITGEVTSLSFHLI